jgi:uncharacterized membrane protein YtjA (UPF0391 family)
MPLRAFPDSGQKPGLGTGGRASLARIGSGVDHRANTKVRVWSFASGRDTTGELQFWSGTHHRGGQSGEEIPMLRWALAFFIVAVIAAVLGFGGIAVAAAGIAKLLFYIFVVLFLVALVSGLLRRA